MNITFRKLGHILDAGEELTFVGEEVVFIGGVILDAVPFELVIDGFDQRVVVLVGFGEHFEHGGSGRLLGEEGEDGRVVFVIDDLLDFEEIVPVTPDHFELRRECRVIREFCVPISKEFLNHNRIGWRTLQRWSSSRGDFGTLLDIT